MKFQWRLFIGFLCISLSLENCASLIIGNSSRRPMWQTSLPAHLGPPQLQDIQDLPTGPLDRTSLPTSSHDSPAGPSDLLGKAELPTSREFLEAPVLQNPLQAQAKVPVWIYFDTGPGHSTEDIESGAIQLCRESLEQRIDSSRFDLRILTNQNIQQYLPSAPKEFYHMYGAAKSDMIRAATLAEYGGVYVDSDIALREDMSTLVEKFGSCEEGNPCDDLTAYGDSGGGIVTNFMIGKKHNLASATWYSAIKDLLSSKCEYDTEGDSQSDMKNGVCCYTPTGKLRRECHVPWGSISSPDRLAEYHHAKQALRNITKYIRGIPFLEAFGAEDQTGQLYWLPLRDLIRHERLHGQIGDNSCQIDGSDLLCKKAGQVINTKGFLKRDGYHLYHVANGVNFKATRSAMLSGSMRNLVISHLFRNLVLGENSLESNVQGLCSSTSVPALKLEALTYIHIPRTGGTTIEQCTVDDPQVKWGVQHPELQGLYRIGKDLTNHSASCYKQHVPTSLLPEVYETNETFCSVRNPYSRMISQFGFARVFYKDVKHCTVQELNRKLLEDLTLVKAGKLYHSDCHYLPQTAYVFAFDLKTGEIDPSKQLCKHVIHTESLDEEFNALVGKHGYGYKLNKPWHAMATPNSCKSFTADDLAPQVRALIEEIFAEDFKLLGYDHYQILAN